MYVIDLMRFEPGMETALVRRILKSGGEIRESRPEITNDGYSGAAAYLWRMVVFQVSKRAAHQCMPVMSYHYLPDIPERDQLAKWLDALADKVVNQIPVTEWHGIARWASIL